MGKFLVPILLLLGLVATSVWSDGPAPRADLTIVEREAVHTLDPAQISHTQDIRIARAVFEGLVRYDVLSEDQRIEPAAAEAMPEISADGRVYTFRIRADARWSNGDPLLASDFVYGWKRAIYPETAADYSNMFEVIRGVPAWAEARREELKTFAKDRAITDRLGAAERLRSAAERDPAARMRLLAEAERISVERDAAVLPLFHYTQFYLFDPRVLSGLSTHPRQVQHLFLLDRRDRGAGAEMDAGVPR